MHIQIYEVLQSILSLFLEANTKKAYKLVISCLFINVLKFSQAARPKLTSRDLRNKSDKYQALSASKSYSSL